MNKRYFLISLVLIVLLSAVVLLHYAPLSSEEGTVVLIHTAEEEVRIAEGDDRFGPLYEECLAVLHNLTPPVEMYVSREDLSNRMDEEEDTYVVLTLLEPTELVHSYHVGENSEKTRSETITLQSAIFGLHDSEPSADDDLLFVITDALREDGSPQVVAYESERGLEHLNALVNASLPGGGGTEVGN
ncbi:MULTISPECIES: hypothetical protein [unclassified Methanoculleus]|jgi:hypothetical protein|uniref:DUF4825 domain-containing protein n=1 Tax=Methanoculleus palmolei TaxID=72612 RepID=A0ABD8AA44_9EURY|nr:hypothetical protein [Methanoculleus sp. UBA377]MDD2473307.1 hypothetical protein [Methanoculleus sp.]WOX55918.1 hypothetical protein R6Y95_00940 [Methanoculleus palmolei]